MTASLIEGGDSFEGGFEHAPSWNVTGALRPGQPEARQPKGLLEQPGVWDGAIPGTSG